MVNNAITMRLTLTTCWICLCTLAASAQHSNSGITVTQGATLYIGPGTSVTVDEGDVHVHEGATLVNNGKLSIARDFIVDGTLQTTLGGSATQPLHGTITVAGDAEYHGSLAVALARGADFRQPQDFTLVNFSNGFGRLTARQLPGARWSANHSDTTLIVRLGGNANSPASDSFALQLDAAPLDGKVLIDWVTYFDSRSHSYAIERIDPQLGWRTIGHVASLGADTEAAYYSTIDSDLPAGEEIIRYRLRLEDASGAWYYSPVVSVYVGTTPQLRVFPNPASGSHVSVIGLDLQRSLVEIRLLSTDGRLLQRYAPSPPGRQLLELPAQLVAGQYVVDVIYADGFRQNTSLLKVR